MPVTKPEPNQDDINLEGLKERFERLHGTGIPCLHPGCGRLVPELPRGRPRLFCDNDCCKRFHRRHGDLLALEDRLQRADKAGFDVTRELRRTQQLLVPYEAITEWLESDRERRSTKTSAPTPPPRSASIAEHDEYVEEFYQHTMTHNAQFAAFCETVIRALPSVAKVRGSNPLSLILWAAKNLNVLLKEIDDRDRDQRDPSDSPPEG